MRHASADFGGCGFDMLSARTVVSFLVVSALVVSALVVAG